MTFNISKVTHCSCGNCSKKVTFIEGIVVGGPEEKPVKYGHVIYDGTLVTNTDEDGNFSLTIPEIKTKRVIVTFKDSSNKEFEERSKVFIIKEGRRVFHKIVLRKMPPPIVFNASEPFEIALGSGSNDSSFGSLKLQNNSLLTENGSVCHGNASAFVSVTDPRNTLDVRTAPGDFTTIEEDGEQGLLVTFGMVKLHFEGDCGEQLVVSKPITACLDPERLGVSPNDAPSIPLNLYWLDRQTERWREVANFMIKGVGSIKVCFVVEISPYITLEILNFDVPCAGAVGPPFVLPTEIMSCGGSSRGKSDASTIPLTYATSFTPSSSSSSTSAAGLCHFWLNFWYTRSPICSNVNIFVAILIFYRGEGGFRWPPKGTPYNKITTSRGKRSVARVYIIIRRLR